MKKITLLFFSMFAFIIQMNAQYCDSTPSSNDGTGISELVVDATTFTSGGDITYEDFTGAAVDLQAGVQSNVQITFATGYTYDTHIWIDFGDDDSFAEAGDLVYSGESLSINPTTLDASFSMPAAAALGVHRMRIGTADSGQATPNPCYTGSYGVTMDLDINITAPPSCLPPVSLTATPGVDTADFTWVAGGTETAWEYALLLATDPAPSSGTAIATTSYMATGLTSLTDYIFYVRSDCGGSYSVFSQIAFTTSTAGAICETAIDVGTLPYNTSDDTANYGDDYSGSPGATGCGTTSSYLNGDDVVYSYTATSDTSINVAMSAIGSTWSGIFVYADCADIGTACIAGEANSGTAGRNFDLAVTNGNTYYIVISTYATPQSTTYTLDIVENTCTNATVAYTVVDDCASSGGFFIDVEVTDMGSATDLTVSNDQDATTHAVTAPGTVQFGPYTNATDVVITVLDDNDANCTQSSSALTQVVCPPANDDCSGAIALTPGAVFSDNPIDGTVEGATDDAEPNACGSNGPGVWYSLVVPASGNITIETAPDAATGDTGFDSLVEAFSGTCGALASIDCDDDGAATNLFSLLELTGLTAGSTIYLRVWESGGGQWEPYSISAYDASLGLEDSQFAGFKYFPNPVEGTLSLRAQNNMQHVAVYNMLGQEVINVTPNTMSSDLNMSALSRGAYFVRVSIDGAVENFKIIKE